MWLLKIQTPLWECYPWPCLYFSASSLWSRTKTKKASHAFLVLLSCLSDFCLSFPHTPSREESCSLFFVAEEREGFQVLVVNLGLQLLWDAVGVLVVLLDPLAPLTVLYGNCCNTYNTHAHSHSVSGQLVVWWQYIQHIMLVHITTCVITFSYSGVTLATELGLFSFHII